MEIMEKPVGELKPYPGNPRVNDEAAKAVAESIREFGFRVPLVVEKDGTVIAGHTRLKAAKMLGLEKVPCVMAGDLSEEEAAAFRLVDNKAAEASKWDYSMLAEELESIDMDMTRFGFSIADTFDWDDMFDGPAKEHVKGEGKPKVCPHCGAEL